ncbi:MAG: Sec-independent protein translocase protein TatB [Anaerolineales bacterium]
MDTNIFGIGMNELIVIFVLAGIVLGPERLARVAREAGKFIRNLKGYFASLTGELKSELDILDVTRQTKTEQIKPEPKMVPNPEPAHVLQSEPMQAPNPEPKLDERLETKKNNRPDGI